MVYYFYDEILEMDISFFLACHMTFELGLDDIIESQTE